MAVAAALNTLWFLLLARTYSSVAREYAAIAQVRPSPLYDPYPGRCLSLSSPHLCHLPGAPEPSTVGPLSH